VSARSLRAGTFCRNPECPLRRILYSHTASSSVYVCLNNRPLVIPVPDYSELAIEHVVPLASGVICGHTRVDDALCPIFGVSLFNHDPRRRLPLGANLPGHGEKVRLNLLCMCIHEVDKTSVLGQPIAAKVGMSEIAPIERYFAAIPVVARVGGLVFPTILDDLRQQFAKGKIGGP
jgi:hypothetical protein